MSDLSDLNAPQPDHMSAPPPPEPLPPIVAPQPPVVEPPAPEPAPPPSADDLRHELLRDLVNAVERLAANGLGGLGLHLSGMRDKLAAIEKAMSGGG